MAAVQGYSYEHQFALEQMLPQATPVIREKLQHQTPITSTRFPISTFTRNCNDIKVIINHMKSNQAAHNDTTYYHFDTANAPISLEVVPLRLTRHVFLSERNDQQYFCLENVT
jgi:hypothetical protein